MNDACIGQLLPGWLYDQAAVIPPCPDDESRMRAVIELSRRNVEEGTGGPFAAAVFDMQSQRLVAAGVNVVVPSRLSIAHAEIVALSVAQERIGAFDLAAAGALALVTSTEPCAMCFGAIPWSGVRRVVCGATSEDACAIGFDEGPRHPRWREELERRGIEVRTRVCRDEAKAVLDAYAAADGLIYNGRSA